VYQRASPSRRSRQSAGPRSSVCLAGSLAWSIACPVSRLRLHHPVAARSRIVFRPAHPLLLGSIKPPPRARIGTIDHPGVRQNTGLAVLYRSYRLPTRRRQNIPRQLATTLTLSLSSRLSPFFAHRPPFVSLGFSVFRLHLLSIILTTNFRPYHCLVLTADYPSNAVPYHPGLAHLALRRI
jgi:hypothetical protein